MSLRLRTAAACMHGRRACFASPNRPSSPRPRRRETHSKDHGPCAAQGDPQGARAALRAVLKGSAPLRRGVCELLRVDYEWLGACNYSFARCVGED